MITFQKATKQDIDAITKIYDDIHTAEEQGKSQIGWVRGVYPTAKTALDALSRNDLFVAKEKETIVGTAIINHTQVEEYKLGNWQFPANHREVMVLHTLVISPSHSGKGYGKAFVAFYETYAKEQGCPFLRMDTNAKNQAARSLYRKLGYKEIGIVPCNFNGIEGISLVLLEKKV